MAQAGVGRYDEALETFARAREADASNLTLLTNTGTVHLMRGEATPARRAFEAALDQDPELPRAQNGLGVLAAREGRLDEAVERWRRAAELDPANYQTLYNLGLTLRRLGRDAEARVYLRAYLEAAPVALEREDMAEVRAWLGRSGG
jgi:tetratricopeptide (TPR) repeat protein